MLPFSFPLHFFRFFFQRLLCLVSFFPPIRCLLLFSWMGLPFQTFLNLLGLFFPPPTSLPSFLPCLSFLILLLPLRCSYPSLTVSIILFSVFHSFFLLEFSCLTLMSFTQFFSAFFPILAFYPVCLVYLYTFVNLPSDHLSLCFTHACIFYPYLSAFLLNVHIFLL